MNSKTISIKELIESGNPPEILFWIGCAGSYDERYKKVTKSFVKILNELNINYDDDVSKSKLEINYNTNN